MRRNAFFLLILLATLAGCNDSSSGSSGAGGGNNNPGGETPPAACADGLDNDGDNLIDFPDDPGCTNAADDNETDIPVDNRLTRYQMANACWVLKANGNGSYVVADGDGYTATAADIGSAERFYLKPTRLGRYALYNTSRQVVSAAGDGTLTNTSSAAATDDAEWTVLATGDDTEYPATPAYNVEPSPEEVALWHGFVDPNIKSETFTLTSETQNQNLAIDENGNLVTAAIDDAPANESFTFEVATDCAQYPEAQSNFVGTPFKGTQPDGTVLGHADVHVHISATEFLGGAQWGRPFHKFGVERALGNCSAQHGDSGQLDLVGGAFGTDFSGHATDGWPTFTDWPARDMLTHEAIYWKWIERAWASGLRVIVNDLVDNETLCELQRNAVGEPDRDCNSMNNAGRQAGTMYAMEDYIDAQYGGRGEGFFQIVHSPEEAREVIEDGKIAVVLGIEISNLFDCKLTYSPFRQQEPFEEDPTMPLENKYGCTTEEGHPNSILTQMQRVHDWGVRQIISIHEFDNAFGGNGIFDGLILNVGNRENSGGIPSGDLANILNFLSAGDAAALEPFLTNLPTTETATGEFWTTYNCPVENETENFSGYLWGNSGGSTQTLASPIPLCQPTGQDGRAGGSTPCYPAGVPQCNARWMTPAGLYTYSKMMEMGFLIDWDHMELGMKTQILEMAELQDPVYPFVSTHGTFGGITIDQATRLMANGGFLYPSNGSSSGFRADMDETFGVYETAMAQRSEAGQGPILFGFGYGTDTNGLSAQTSPRNKPENPIVYPYQLFAGSPFDSLPMFNGVAPITFNQPNSTDTDGTVQQTWHEDEDGNAHYGMLSGFVQEIVLDSESPKEQIKHLFNSAEAYLQTWERTEASAANIRSNGGITLPDSHGILRPAPPAGALPR